MRSRARRAPDWSRLLVEAVQRPGVLSDAYRRFWNYSVGNQLLAQFECLQRGLELGPLHTFMGWLELGRHVRKGEKAITLCMPVQVKQKLKSGDGASTGTREKDLESAAPRKGATTIFVFRPHWFVLSQTEGAPYIPTELPAWSESRALEVLRIERVVFTHTNGNCQGYARDGHIAVSPVAALPHQTLFHEMAHCIIGHTQEKRHEDHERTPKTLREVEAECVALICCESLGLAGAAESRGYIQHWMGRASGEAIPNRSAQRIFRAADAILKSGHDPPVKK